MRAKNRHMKVICINMVFKDGTAWDNLLYKCVLGVGVKVVPLCTALKRSQKVRRKTTILKSNQKGREGLERCSRSKVKKVFQDEKNYPVT